MLYVSRSNLGDVAAFESDQARSPAAVAHVRRGPQGRSRDHLARRKPLVVSATGTLTVADVFDARTGKIVGSFPTGDYPHQNDYSADGKYIYNSSIGNVGYQAVSYAKQRQKRRSMARQGRRARRFRSCKTWEFDWGIRPNVITPDGSIMYAQLSYLNGVIKYDLNASKEIARSDQPLSEFAMNTYATYDEYPHDSAHHGLALSGDGKKLCDCGTVDNTVTIVRTDDMQVAKTIDVGMVPYWATTSPDGQHCFVSLSGDDAVSGDRLQGRYRGEGRAGGQVSAAQPARARAGAVDQAAVAFAGIVDTGVGATLPASLEIAGAPVTVCLRTAGVEWRRAAIAAAQY